MTKLTKLALAAVMKLTTLALAAVLFATAAIADFDRTDPADLLALQTEVATDPLGMGYVPEVGTTAFLDLLNNPAKNLGGEIAQVLLTSGVLLDVLVPSDLNEKKVGDGERRFIEAMINRDFETDIERYREQIREALLLDSETVFAIDTIMEPISRAQVLFGRLTVISSADLSAAGVFTRPRREVQCEL